MLSKYRVFSAVASTVKNMPNTSLTNRITVSAAAFALGLSRKTVYAACTDGRLPSYRVGNRIYLDIDSLSEVKSLGSRAAAVSFSRISNSMEKA